MPNCLILPAHLLYSDNKMFVRPDRFYWNVKVTLRTLGVFIPSREINCKRYCRYLPEKSFIDIFGSSREFVGKSERDTSEPVVSQAAIRHNRSRWSLLFRLPFDSRQNLMWIRLLPVWKKKCFFSSKPHNMYQEIHPSFCHEMTEISVTLFWLLEKLRSKWAYCPHKFWWRGENLFSCRCQSVLEEMGMGIHPRESG